MINTPNENHEDGQFKVFITGIDKVTGEKCDLFTRDEEGKPVVSDLIYKECYPPDALKQVNHGIKAVKRAVEQAVSQKRDYIRELKRLKNMTFPPQQEIHALEQQISDIENSYAERVEILDAMKQVRKILRQRCKK